MAMLCCFSKSQILLFIVVFGVFPCMAARQPSIAFKKIIKLYINFGNPKTFKKLLESKSVPLQFNIIFTTFRKSLGKARILTTTQNCDEMLYKSI